MTNDLVKTSTPAILYSFGSMLSHMAMVVRNESFFGAPQVFIAHVGNPPSSVTDGELSKIPLTYPAEAVETRSVEELSVMLANANYAQHCASPAEMDSNKDLVKACAPVLNFMRRLNGGFGPLIP